MNQKSRILLSALTTFLPWKLRRLILQKACKYSIHPTAYISKLSIIVPEKLDMQEHSRISARTFALNIHELKMGCHSRIGRSNWITGHPRNSSKHFVHVRDRNPSLHLGDHSAITKGHIIDCTDCVSIGQYTTMAGYNSQIITHGIDYMENRQNCAPVSIGSHCIMGSRVIILGGSSLPDKSVLAAGATLNKAYDRAFSLYAGNPAEPKKMLSESALYMQRTVGFVD